jgi:hypothetical protein
MIGIILLWHRKGLLKFPVCSYFDILGPINNPVRLLALQIIAGIPSLVAIFVKNDPHGLGCRRQVEEFKNLWLLGIEFPF